VIELHFLNVVSCKNSQEKIWRNLQSLMEAKSHVCLHVITGAPLLMALVRGDIKSMFSYEDHPEKPVENKKED